MRARALCAAVLAAVALAGCGGGADGDGNSTGTTTQPDPGSAQREVRVAIKEYVAALGGPDPGKVCDLLTSRAQAALASFLPSTAKTAGCDDIAKQVARRSVALRRVRVGRISVQGRTATARITSKDPPYDSEVLLSDEEGEWKINYPPGLVEKYRTPPGVPIESQD